jgi:cobalt-zinc-cadmium efflux system outer membrane protein
MKLKIFNCQVWMTGIVIHFVNSLSAAEAPSQNARAISTNQVTLQSLVDEALEKNPELRFYESEIAVAKAARRTAGQLPNPELSASAGHKRVSGSLVAEGLAWSVSVAQPFEWPGRIGLRKAIANRDLELAELGLERFRVALAARARAMGYRLFAAQQKAAAAREVAERFGALREVLVQRDPAGVTPLLETRVIEATEVAMQRKASEAGIATEAALLELNQLRAAPGSSRVSVARTDLTFRPADHVEELLALARTNDFEIRVRAVELAQQGFRVDLAKNERLPSVSVGPMVTEERAGDRERIISLGVSLPLPLWNRNAGNIEAAAARKMQAEVSLAVAQREIERKVTGAAVAYQARLAQMAKWRPDSVEHFRNAAELADRHYRLGAVPLATYLELQKQYLEAIESLLDTKTDALEAAHQLELLTGRNFLEATQKLSQP